MGNKPNYQREKLIEAVEAQIIMGYKSPTEILKIFPNDIKDWDTARRYIRIAERRLRNRYKEIDRNKILKKEIRDLEYMEKRLWKNFKSAINDNISSGAINTIIKVKERRAKLLGLDTENVNQGHARTLEDLIRENREKAQKDGKHNTRDKQTNNRGASMGSEQDGGKGAVQAKSDTDEIRKSKDE